MWEMVKEVVDYRALLFAFTKRNVMMKYKQTIMGFLWAIFMPTIIVLSGIVVKIAMSKLSGKPFEFSELASVTVKALPWAFFVGALKFSVNSLVGNMQLVKRVYFPREVFPLSYIIGQLVDFVIAGAAFAVILAFMKVGASVYLLWLPLLIVFLILFTAGLGMFLSGANLFFRDIRYIVDVLLTFGIFFTPVFYDARMFGRFESLILMNPIAALMENMNAVIVLHQAPDYFWLIYAGVISIVVFLGGWRLFHKMEPLFAEKI